MNKNINLCEILKGLEGIELYSTIFGKVVLEKIKYPIIIVRTINDLSFDFDYRGYYYNDSYPEAECTIFPSKTQRDWNEFEQHVVIERNTPMMCSNNPFNRSFYLRYYALFKNKKHYVYDNGEENLGDYGPMHYWDCMIPYDKFDPNNIEESLKYNIQK